MTAALATRNRRVGVIATPATVRSHAYFAAIKDENPAVEVYEHATPAFVPLVEAGLLSGPEVEAAVAEALAPLLGERDAAGEFVFPLPASARIDTLLLGCTHYPLLRPVIEAVAGEGIAIVDSATATASALDGAARDQRPRGARAARARRRHVQLTTGDVDAFRSVAGRLFGDAFLDVERIELIRGRRSRPPPPPPPRRQLVVTPRLLRRPAAPLASRRHRCELDGLDIGEGVAEHPLARSSGRRRRRRSSAGDGSAWAAAASGASSPLIDSSSRAPKRSPTPNRRSRPPPRPRPR